ncbi:MAG: hypothetical protein H8E39_02390 [Alphaproteobacteria bacterium]|nr:hypothetical protein [Alphaproteobacteria bacterium]
MNKKTLTATALAAALVLGAAFAGQTYAHGWDDDDDYRGRYGHHGMMRGQMGGPGMMGGGGGYGMGRGMMGYGGGYGGDCPFANKAAFAPNVTTDTVTKFLELRLTHMGNDRLKVGEVKEVDDKTITGEIVTKDGSLVMKMQFDRATGRHVPIK